jgi:hypothetical protein
LEGRTPYEAVHGNTPDISSLTSFDFYDPVWYYDQTVNFPEPKRKMARWLGEAQDFGQAMCYWILPTSGTPIVRSTVQPITEEQHRMNETIQELQSLDEQISIKLGDILDDSYDLNNPNIIAEDLPDYVTPQYEPLEPSSSMPEADEWDAEAFDKYISAEVMLPRDDEYLLGKVM